MKNFRLIAASSFGTILEWYDFSLFATLSPFLATHFFPHQNPTAALMLTYAIFAVGYFVRPLGAMFFGHMGDHLGRKQTLVWTILLMSLPTFLMGLLPTYDAIGLMAPTLLIVLRLCQGFSAGGESTGAILFVMESIPAERRGFMSALVWAMTGVGMLMGSLAVMIVAHFDNVTWAWRVPFLLGIVTGIVGYLLRRYTTESLLFAKILKDKVIATSPLWEGIIKYKKSILIIMGLYTLSAMITYLVFVFMPSYATNIVGLPLSQTTFVSTSAFFASMILVPLGGYVSDIIGRENCLRWSAIGFVLLSYPLFWMISQGVLTKFIFAEIIFLLMAAGFQGAVYAAVFNLVPTRIRYSVIAVGYNVSFSLFGGTAPFMAAYLVNLTGNKAAPGLYLSLGAVIALTVAMKIKNNEEIYVPLQYIR